MNCGPSRELVDEWAQPLPVDRMRAARPCETLASVRSMIVWAVPNGVSRAMGRGRLTIGRSAARVRKRSAAHGVSAACPG